MFSKGIFKSNLKRFWIIPAVVTIVLFLVVTFQMIIKVEDIKEREERNNYINTVVVENTFLVENTQSYIEPINVELVNQIQPSIEEMVNNIETIDVQEEIVPIQIDQNQSRYFIRLLYNPINILIIFVITIIISILLFGYANEEKSSSFIHGLPISKKRLYITNAISGILMYVIPYVINLIILLIVNFGDMGNYLQSVELFKWFGVCILYNTVFFSFSTIVGMICASKISHGILTYVLMYAPTVGLLFLNKIIEQLLYGFNGLTDKIEELFSKIPFIKIIEIFQEMNSYYSGELLDIKLNTVIIYIITSIIMLLVGYLIYKNRKLEVTKEFIAFDLIRSIIKYCAILCVNLISYAYFDYVFDGKISVIIASLIITIIAYFIIEMILRKTYKVLKSVKGLIIYVCIIMVLYFVTVNGFFGFETRIPQIDKVKEVSITKYNEELVFDEKENVQNIINMHKEIVNDRLEGYTQYVINYTLNDGSKISRKYEVKENKYQYYINKIKESEEYTEEKMKFLNNEGDIENIKIELSYYTNNYKYNDYRTINIDDSKKHDFIQALKQDIKEKKAGFDSTMVEKLIFNESGNIITVRVNVTLKNNKTKYIIYSTENIKDSNIAKYIKNK